MILVCGILVWNMTVRCYVVVACAGLSYCSLLMFPLSHHCLCCSAVALRITGVCGKQTKKDSGEEDTWEDGLHVRRIRGWRAVSTARLQGSGLHERNVFSSLCSQGSSYAEEYSFQTPVS